LRITNNNVSRNHKPLSEETTFKSGEKKCPPNVKNQIWEGTSKKKWDKKFS